MSDRKWVGRGVLLGLAFFLAVLFVKPIGVSTQFSVLSGIFHTALNESIIQEDEQSENGYRSSNAYYDRKEGKLAANIMDPWNYDFIFVLAIPVGGYLAYRKNNKRDSNMATVPAVNGGIRSCIPSFLGGLILLYGARFADGCTSGHMMSGMMQGSVSGYVFALCVFAVAIPLACLKGRRRQQKREDDK